jgi:predicted small secreted protein
MKNISLNILLMSILTVWAFMLVGCNTVMKTTGDAVMGMHDAEAAILGGHGLGETEIERADDHSRQLSISGSQLIDDTDAWWYTDQATRLTEFTLR